MANRGIAAGLLSALHRAAARLVERLPRRRPEPLPPGETSGEEQSLCREMESYWLRQRHRGLPAPALTVSMVDARGLVPSAWFSGPQGNELFLRRRHRLVISAAKSVARDRANVELAAAALAAEHFLTAAAP